MNAASYMLWDKIKAQIKRDGSVKGCCSLDGTKSGIRAANELSNAGFIRILRLNPYELEYYVELLDECIHKSNL